MLRLIQPQKQRPTTFRISIAACLLSIFWVTEAVAQAPIQKLESQLKATSSENRTAILNDLSEAYQSKSINKARDYAEAALEHARKSDNQPEEARAQINLSWASLALGKHQDAVAHATAGLALAKKGNHTRLVAKAWSLIGRAYDQVGSTNFASEAYLVALQASEECDDKPVIAQAATDLGKLLARAGKTEDSLPYFEKALAIRKELRDKPRVGELYKLLAKTHQELRNAEKALAYQRLFAALEDELIGEQRQKRISELERQFNWEKKQKEIELLRHNKKLHHLKIARQPSRLAALQSARRVNQLSIQAKQRELIRMEKEHAVKAFELTRQQQETARQAETIRLLQQNAALQSSVKKVLITVFLSSALIALFITSRYQRKRKAELHLHNITAEIAHQNAIVEQQAAQLARINEELERATVTDLLTTLPNRRFFSEFVFPEISRRLEKWDGADVIFYLIDLDHFKQVNDVFGHEVGDQVLVAAAERFRSALRSGDEVARWGGEEFLVVLRDQDRQSAELLAERLLQAIGSTVIEINDETQVRLTTSIGWTALPWSIFYPQATSITDILKITDRALYVAKRSGRNQAVGLLCTTPQPIGDLDQILDETNLSNENSSVRLIRTIGCPYE